MSVELTLLSRVAYRGREVTAPRLRDLLALLAGDLRPGASTARLVDGLWPDERPDNPAKAVQVLVARARAQLGADLIARTATGYRLALGEDQVDATAVLVSATASARYARAGDHAAALAQAEAGLALWDGMTTADGDGDRPADGRVAELRTERATVRRALLREQALALARLGRHAEAVGPLTELVRGRPRDEELLLELLRAEAATAGPSAALARYDAYRQALRDELGTDPGPGLASLHAQLLRGETPAARYGVPHEPNPLLGRDGDLAAVAELLRTSRVTSIVGAGGLGKTRLAYAVSRQAEQRTVYLVGLAGITTDGDVAAEVAAVLGLGEARPGGLGHVPTTSGVAASIAAALGPGPALLVLDNCEHVIRGAAELVRALTAAAGNLRVLTTSRAPLGLTSESVYLLPELDLNTAVQLFGQRARAARPGVELPPDAVENVCRHLDGLPLAVELAAARVRVMSVAEIAARLADRFGLLRGGARDAPERHQALHAVVDWSWHLLAPEGRAAMRALSVFPGGFTADAARHVVAGPESAAGDVLDILEHLVDQSLLKVSDTPAGTRFRMLETVREYSTARREAAGETDRAIEGLAAWTREVARAHHDGPFGTDPYESLALIRIEQDNLVQALRHGLARADAGTVAAATALLGALWVIESNYSRLVTVVEETAWPLSHWRPGPDLVEVTRTALMVCEMFLISFQGPRPTRGAVALRRLPPAPPDTVVRACAVLLGALYGTPDDVFALCDSDQPLLAAAAGGAASYLWEVAGEPDRALEAARRMSDGFASQGTQWLAALGHCRIAELGMQLDLGEEVRRHLLAALPVLDRLGAGTDVTGIRWWLVLASLQLGDVDEAERWLEPAIAADVDVHSGTLGYDLGIRAEILLARGDVDAGLRTWRRVVDQLTIAGDRSSEIVPPGLDPWVLEARAITIVAHARHGRLALVEDVVAELPGRLAALLDLPPSSLPPYVIGFPLTGAVLLALGLADIDRGRRTGEAGALRSGARLVALAQRLRHLRSFRPTMSPDAARRAARDADGPAYDEAVSSYAGLDSDQLRAAAQAAVRERHRTAGPRL